MRIFVLCKKKNPLKKKNRKRWQNILKYLSKIYNNNFARPEKHIRKAKPDTAEAGNTRSGKQIIAAQIKNSSDGFTKARIRTTKVVTPSGASPVEENYRKSVNSEIPMAYAVPRGALEKKDTDARKVFDRKLISSESKKKSADEIFDMSEKPLKRKGSDFKPEEARIVNAVFKDDIIKVGKSNMIERNVFF